MARKGRIGSRIETKCYRELLIGAFDLGPEQGIFLDV